MLSIASSAASPPRRTCGRSAAPGPRLARVCPSGRASARPCRRGPGVAGSSRCRRAWGSPPAMDSGQGRRQQTSVPWCYRRCPGMRGHDSAGPGTDLSGAVGHPAEFFAGSVPNGVAAIGDTKRRTATDRSSPSTSSAGRRGNGRSATQPVRGHGADVRSRFWIVPRPARYTSATNACASVGVVCAVPSELPAMTTVPSGEQPPPVTTPLARCRQDRMDLRPVVAAMGLTVARMSLPVRQRARVTLTGQCAVPTAGERPTRMGNPPAARFRRGHARRRGAWRRRAR